MKIKADIYTYEFDETTGALTILRQGKDWRRETGDNALLALMQKCEKLQEMVENVAVYQGDGSACPETYKAIVQDLGKQARDLLKQEG